MHKSIAQIKDDIRYATERLHDLQAELKEAESLHQTVTLQLTQQQRTDLTYLMGWDLSIPQYVADKHVIGTPTAERLTQAMRVLRKQLQ